MFIIHVFLDVVCAQNDRTEFNSNVLEIISGEYRKETTTSRSGEGKIVEHNREIVQWKFDQLDVNG